MDISCFIEGSDADLHERFRIWEHFGWMDQNWPVWINTEGREHRVAE